MNSGRRRSWVRIAWVGLAVAALPGNAGEAPAPACNFCEVGRNQSPVRLADALVAPAASGPTVTYVAETVEVENHVKNLQVTYPAGARSGMTFDAPGNRFELWEFHFHAPGEHPFGQAQPGVLEIHFVHRRNGALAVVGVPIALGTSTHPHLRELFTAIPAPGQPRRIEFNARSLAFHRGVRMLRYSGSLTTGTCDEGVSWFFYDSPNTLTVTEADLKRYRDAFPADYARSVQPIGARRIVRVAAPRLGLAKP